MKKNLKLMTAAMSLVALASCTDDLNVKGSQQGIYGKDDLVASLQLDEAKTRFAMQEESDKVKGGSSKKVVWSDQDQIRVFTLDKLSQDLYEIKSGAGESNAVFQRIADSGLTGEKFAITEATSIYGISATRVDGKDLPLLTVTLPGEYTAGDDGQGNKNFPVPYWGKVTSMSGTDANTNISASFTGLAAFLRVGLKELPAGTRAIVLTTHGDRTGNIADEGFQISKTFPMDGGNIMDFQQEGGILYWANHAAFPVTTGGKSEAISGTLNAVLDPSKDRNDVFLQVDDRLVKSDTLRVNLVDDAGNYIYDPATENQVFYIPIVVGTYENLHVLAVTGDSKYSYTWVGEELHNFRNETFKNNKAYYLDMNFKTFALADINTINQQIAKLNATAGVTTVINVEELTDNDADGLDDNDVDFSTTEVKVVGEGNLVLNIKDMTASYTAANFTVEEGEDEIAATETPTSEFNFDPTYANPVEITSPLRKVILGTVDGVNSMSIEATVTGPADKYVMSYDIYENVEQYQFMVQKNSALTIKNGFKKVTVSDSTEGDIYVYSDAEETEVLELEVLSPYNNNIRISSALVAAIEIEDVTAGEREIWTDGSAAMKTVTDLTGPTYPKNTHTYSYYTGAGLSDYAWLNGYDQDNIYTAAQLQSMGANARTIDGFVIPNPGTATGSYTIPNAFVGSIWLGSKEFPWIGPEVTMDNFELDGELTALRNMKIDVDGVSNTIYIDDPHYCCTSCGLPGTETTLAITDDLGLIRSIEGTTAATVKNVNLNDVLIDTDNEIDNIGAIVGRVEITGADFTFQDNILGEVKIDVNGDNVGGMIGYLEADAITIENNTNIATATNKSGGFVKSDKGYVGGLVGNAVANAAVNLNNNTVNMKDNVEAGEGYAAGMIGAIDATGAVIAVDNTVTVKDITAVESYAAGLIGYMESDTYGSFTGSTVTAKNIATDDLYAGGLIGQASCGPANALVLRNSTVAVQTELKAENGQLGGLLGNIKQASNVYVNQATATDQNTTITVAKMKGGYAAGGILGSNDSGIGLTVYTGHTDTWTNQVNVTVSAYESTKSATDYTFAEAYKYGTMQDIIGYKQGKVKIFKDKLTTSGVLDDAAKKAVHYDAHLDTGHTVLAEELYWGDNNGYVGFGYTGVYTISDATDYTGGATVPSEVEGGYNYFQAY